MYKWILLVLIFLSSCKSEGPTVPVQLSDFCSTIHRDSLRRFSPLYDKVKKRAESQSAAYSLEDGSGSLVTRAWLSEYAEESIDIQYFIFSTDNVGLIACDYLVRAADRGIKVRVIVDDILVDAKVTDILALDAHPNIDLKIYNPSINIGKSLIQKTKNLLTDFRGINQRMHNKTFIVDKKVVITGGRNIADEYFDYDHEYNFRDRDVLLIGKVCQDINLSFEDFWNHELSVAAKKLVKEEDWIKYDPINFNQLRQYACSPENFWPHIRTEIDNLPLVFERMLTSESLVWMDSLAFVSDIPGKNDLDKGLGGGGASTDALIALVKNAQKSIDIQSPYLVTTELSRNLFKEAIDRGVQVNILTNSLASTDNLEAFNGYQRDREALLKTGVRIFEYKPDARERYEVMTSELQQKLNFKPIFGLHAKSMVVDERISVIGTFNLDPRSANLNTECLAIMHSELFTKRVIEAMKQSYLPENSWETTLDFNPDGTVERKKRIKTWMRKIVPKGIL